MDRRRELIDKARAAARELGVEELSLRAFTARTGIRHGAVYQHFDSWAALCHGAGISAARDTRRVSDEEVYAAMRDALVACGGVGTHIRFQLEFRYTRAVFTQRWRTWREALFAFRGWAEKNAPDFPYMDQLPDTPAPAKWAGPPESRKGGPRGRRLGAAFGYRAMQHAPVNEQGVVLLFGMVAEELGFLIETVETGFPDCEGKRRAGDGTWHRVRIEFEFRSGAFRIHRHDPAGCDLIVCWTHDWRDCPLEVLELKSLLVAAAGKRPA